ncbi:MAG: hypothetical protein QG588_2375 [Candidatus Poribacteria bacterium]|nr:hypothetical protein [Candidatus Poribacteria bacterium]
MSLLLIMIFGLIIAISAEDKSAIKPVPTVADNSDVNLAPNDIPKLIEIIKVWKLIDEVELDKISEDKLVKFLAKYRQLDQIRFKYHKDKMDSIEKMRKLLETNASEEQIKFALNEIDRVDEIFQQREKQMLDALNSNLTPKQQAEFIVFQDNHWREMKQMISGLKELSTIKERRLNYQTEALSRNR